MKYRRSLLTFLLAVVSSATFCQWNSDTITGGKMTIAGMNQFDDLFAFTDNSGGTIQVYEKITWEYAPGINRYGIHLQRTDTMGQLLWGNADSGRALYQTFDDNEFLNLINAASDNNGGAYVLFWGKTQPDPSPAWGFRVQHIDNNGNTLWPGYGTVLFETTEIFYNTDNAKMNVDDAGNVFVVWRNADLLYSNLFAQKVNTTGTKLWNNGSGVQVSLTGLQAEFLITADNAGGLMAVFEDGRNSIYDPENDEFDHLELFAQHINSTGQLTLGAGGVIAAGETGDSMILASENATNGTILPDGNGGCYFVYGRFIGANGGDILLQRISAAGQRPWGNYGVLATGAGEGTNVYDYRLYQKPGGGVSGVYSVDEGSFYHLPLKLQYFNQDGSSVYTEPIKVAEASFVTTSSAQPVYDALFYTDGAAAIVFLGTADSQFVRMQQMKADGSLLYGLNGKTLMKQTTYMLQAVSGTGTFSNLVWQDKRNYPFFVQAKDAFITKFNREIPAARRTIYSVNNGNWNSPSTWLNNIIPGPDDLVIISHTVNVTVNTTCYALSVEPGGNIIVAAGINFTILH